MDLTPERPSRHSFGGVHRHVIVNAPPFPIPLTLLHVFDVGDLGFAKFQFPQFPVYYPLSTPLNHIGYRLVEKDRIELLTQPFDQPISDADWPSVPLPLKETPLTLRESRIDLSMPMDAMLYRDVFGVEPGLSVDQRFGIMEFLLRRFESTQTLNQAVSLEQFFADGNWSSVFSAARPATTCPNSECTNSNQPGKLTVLALISPEIRLDAWAEVAHVRQDGQLVVEFCHQCQAIRVTNTFRENDYS